MKNTIQDTIFSQELVDGLMVSFDEDAAEFSRLASPLSNIDLEPISA